MRVSSRIASINTAEPGQLSALDRAGCLPARCRGVALITAVLIISLITVAATAMAARQLLDSRRTGNIMHSDQAYVYALAAEQAVARAMVDFDTDKNVDHAGEEWYALLSQGVPLTMPNGTVIAKIRDVTASFPLNSLVDGATGNPRPQNFRMLQAILETLLTDPPAPELPAAIRDWIDPNADVSAGGAEDLDYLNMDPPYRAANRPLTSLSELRLVAGMKAEDYPKLLASAGGVPLFNTLPGETPININSAPKEVILNLHERIDETIANDIITRREEALDKHTAPYTDANKFFQEVKDKIFVGNITDPAEIKAKNEFKLDADIGVKSDYFEVTTVAQIGKTEVMLHSLLKREDNKVTTIRRGIGVN